jgi:hypothetical protein
LARELERLRLRLLRDPAPIRIRGAAGEPDAAVLKLDEEEHIVAPQEGSLDREEGARQDARCPLAQELAPGRVGCINSVASSKPPISGGIAFTHPTPSSWLV